MYEKIQQEQQHQQQQKHYSNYKSPTGYNNVFCYASWVYVRITAI